MCLFREAGQIKNKQVYFVLRSACAIFGKTAKIGCALEAKISKLILCFSRLALSL